VITHKRSITEADIVNFGNVSWDHFYAHTDTTSLETGETVAIATILTMVKCRGNNGE